MKKFLSFSLLVFCGVVSTVALPQAAKDKSKTDVPAQQSKATIEGLVRDIACPIQNLEATPTHLSMKCLQACAKPGSPLAVLTKYGELYLPISDKMPPAIRYEVEEQTARKEAS